MVSVTSPRPLKNDERALLDGFLALDFEGVVALRDQARGAMAAPGCTCGCGSLSLFPNGASPRSTAASPIPSEGRIRDDAGEEVGGLLLFLDTGRLSYMEVYSYFMEVYSYFDPLPLPPPEHVHWTAVQREG